MMLFNQQTCTTLAHLSTGMTWERAEEGLTGRGLYMFTC